MVIGSILSADIAALLPRSPLPLPSSGPEMPAAPVDDEAAVDAVQRAMATRQRDGSPKDPRDQADARPPEDAHQTTPEAVHPSASGCILDIYA